jgi:mRNA interferase HicA
MKRTDLIRKLEEDGCVLVRHGGNHDLSQAVPRHLEVNQFLAKHILKKLAN